MPGTIYKRTIRVCLLKSGLFFLYWLLLLPLWSANYALQYKSPNLAVYAGYALEPAVKQTMQRLDARIDDLQMQVGVYVQGRAGIWLVESPKAYQELALGKAPIVEFSEAFYSGSEGRIYLRPFTELKDDYLKTLLHEYLHWYLEQLFSKAPLWFHEGMAMHFSGQMGFDNYLFFLQQGLLGRSSDLYRLSSSYPARQSDWPVFYLSSSLAIRYMSGKHPENWKSFWDLVAYYNRKGEKADFSHCFIMAYRISLYDFHQSYAKWQRKLRWTYLLWGLNAALVLILPWVVVLGYRKRRRLMHAMPDFSDQEKPSNAMPLNPEWQSQATIPYLYNPDVQRPKRKVLILCTGNSCRSIMAEALVNNLLKDSWLAYSAGVKASEVNPKAVQVLQEAGIPTEGLRSKGIEEFSERSDLDLVITVCDNAKQSCPIFLQPVKTVHFDIPDPAPWTNEPDETALPMFRETLLQIRETVISLLQDYPV